MKNLFMFLLMLISTASCDLLNREDNKKEMLIGSWRLGVGRMEMPTPDNAAPPYSTITFQKDGTVVLENLSGNGEILRKFTGDWKFEDNNLINELNKQQVFSSEADTKLEEIPQPLKISYLINFKIQEQDTLFDYFQVSGDTINLVGTALKLNSQARASE